MSKMQNGLQELDLSNANMTNTDTLPNTINSLNLDCCDGGSDVSMLGKLTKLKIVWCRNITELNFVDVPNNLHTVDIDNSDISDVSALCNVHTQPPRRG